jgi:F420-dependent oxidoreductase-like protein
VTALGASLAQLAQSAEAAGFDSFWTWDHLLWDESPVGPGVTDRPMLEAYTTLGFIAAATKTMKIGTMVTGVTYRHPGVLIKQVTTLDVLSGGRAYFGIGAGWFGAEHHALGIPFASTKERFERLEETLQIAHLMWADQGDYAIAQPFHGKYYQLERTLNVPQSLQRPHPPILVGGNGERTTLRLVAQYGDACNIYSADMPELDRKLAALRGHCERLGRDYATIEKTYYIGTGHVSRTGEAGANSVDQTLAFYRELAHRGIDHLIVSHEQIKYYDPSDIELWTNEVIPAVHDLVPGTD